MSWRQAGIRALHLAVLWAFAFAQPLFDLLAENPEFFIARNNGRADILIFSFALVLIPPALMIGAERLVGLANRRAENGLHLGLIGILAAALVLQLLKGIASGPAGVLIVLALAAGAGAAYIYQRDSFLPTALTYLAAAPALFLFIFLVTSPVSKLVIPQGEAEAASASIDSRMPVVVLFFDEFPTTSLMNSSYRVDTSRFPNFAELERSATWYRNGSAAADFTERAVPSILTGSDPGQDKLPIATDQPRNLFTVFGGSYRVNALEAVTHLCPERICGNEDDSESLPERLGSLTSDLSLVSEHLLLPDSIRAQLTPVNQTFGNLRGRGADEKKERARQARRELEQSFTDRPGQFQSIVRRIDGRDRALYFIHSELPHSPYQYLPDGRQYEGLGGLPGPPTTTGWRSDQEQIDRYHRAHLLQTGEADRLLGELIAKMKKEGIWDRALLVVTADHGVSFRPNDYSRVANKTNLPETAGVPLFVKEPGQTEGRVIDGGARVIDILPTIADVLGFELPFETQGKSLLDGPTTDEVAVHNRFGKIVRMPIAEFARQQRAIVARNLALFGSETGWAPVYSGYEIKQ